MNLTKRLNVKFVSLNKLKNHVRSNKLISAEPINQEGKVFEVRKKKSVIVDRIPVHCSAMILSSAKLHVIEFIKDLAEELDCQAFRVIYMGKNIIYMTLYNLFLDTDSLFLAMSKNSIDDLVKDNPDSNWDLIKMYWFVEDQDDKTPGNFYIFCRIYDIFRTFEDRRRSRRRILVWFESEMLLSRNPSRP